MNPLRHFLLKATLFFSPIMVLFLLGLYALWHFGEFTSNATLIARYERGEQYLYGKNYFPSPREVKDEIIEKYPPDIIVLGDSRSFQMRKEFFKPEFRFYCWSQIGNVDDMRTYLRRFEHDPAHAPKVIVLIVDHHVMVARGIADRKNVVGDGVGKPQWLQIFSQVMTDIVTGEIPLATLFAPKDPARMGTLAVVNHVGYRNDGSISYGDRIPGYEHKDHEDYQFRYYLRMVERGLNNLKQGSTPSTESLAVFEDFLTEAQRQGIHVVTILPPFAPTIYTEMQKPQYAYGYIEKMIPLMESLTKRTGHTFYDFTDPASLALRDEDFFDGIHWSETANAEALLRITETDTTLAPYVDDETLRNKLSENTSKSRYLFGY